MKKLLLLLLPILMLLMACPLEEEEPEPYNGTWKASSILGDQIFMFDNSSFTETSFMGKVKGKITKNDNDTITLSNKEYDADGIWLSIEGTALAVDRTYDWSINGDILKLTDTEDNTSSNYTKQ